MFCNRPQARGEDRDGSCRAPVHHLRECLAPGFTAGFCRRFTDFKRGGTGFSLGT